MHYILALILIVWVQGIHHANIQLHNEERYLVSLVACISLYLLARMVTANQD